MLMDFRRDLGSNMGSQIDVFGVWNWSQRISVETSKFGDCTTTLLDVFVRFRLCDKCPKTIKDRWTNDADFRMRFEPRFGTIFVRFREPGTDKKAPQNTTQSPGKPRNTTQSPGTRITAPFPQPRARDPGTAAPEAGVRGESTRPCALFYI